MKRYIRTSEVLEERIRELQQNPEFCWRMPSLSYLSKLYDNYSSVSELYEDGFTAVNDFSLDTLLKRNKIIARDYDPINNVVNFYLWDEDFKRWIKVAKQKV